MNSAALELQSGFQICLVAGAQRHTGMARNLPIPFALSLESTALRSAFPRVPGTVQEQTTPQQSVTDRAAAALPRRLGSQLELKSWCGFFESSPGKAARNEY